MSEIDQLLQQLPTDAIAARLGEDPASVESAARAALPALFGGLQANAADPVLAIIDPPERRRTLLAAAVFTSTLARHLKRVGRLGRALRLAAGGIMVLMGLAMLTGQLSSFSYWLLETFPVLGTIG